MECTNESKGLLEQYAEEYKADVTLEAHTLDDKLMMVPGIKAKWVTRIYTHKKEMVKLDRLRFEARSKAVEELSKTSQVKLSRAALENAADDHPTVRKVSERLAEVGIVVEYLEKIAKCLSDLTYDLKNKIEWHKLELT